MTEVRKLIKNYGTISQTTSQQPQQEIPIPAGQDIKALLIEVTNAMTIGTGAVETNELALDTIAGLKITDKNTETILPNIGGKDMVRLYKMQNPRGQRPITNPALADGSTVARMLLPIRIGVKDQPAKLTLTIAAIGDNLSTVGTATMTVTVLIWAIYTLVRSQGHTTRVKIFNTTGAVGDNDISENYQNAAKGKRVTHTALYISDENGTQADTDLTDLTLRSSNKEEFEAVTDTFLIGEEENTSEGTHYTGLFIIRHTPFTMTKLAVLSVNLAVARTGVDFRTYVIVED